MHDSLLHVNMNHAAPISKTTVADFQPKSFVLSQFQSHWLCFSGAVMPSWHVGGYVPCHFSMEQPALFFRQVHQLYPQLPSLSGFSSIDKLPSGIFQRIIIFARNNLVHKYTFSWCWLPPWISYIVPIGKKLQNRTERPYTRHMI